MEYETLTDWYGTNLLKPGDLLTVYYGPSAGNLKINGKFHHVSNESNILGSRSLFLEIPVKEYIARFGVYPPEENITENPEFCLMEFDLSKYWFTKRDE